MKETKLCLESTKLRMILGTCNDIQTFNFFKINDISGGHRLLCDIDLRSSMLVKD